jgi:hypothetical protein
MDRAQLFLVAIQQGIPLPHPGEPTVQDRALLVYRVGGLSVQSVGQRLLDFTTPLHTIPLDVRGNAQHWVIRTADAALSSTIPNWLARFETEEAWQTVYVERMNPPWQSYLRDTGTTRRGLPLATAKRKHDVRAQRAYEKAIANWHFAFRDDAEEFYKKVIARADDFAKATQDFLGYVGLRIQAFIGAFSLHIMALCGNPEVAGLMGHRENLTAFSLPDPPIIQLGFRPSLNQEIMALLCRDFFLAFPQPDIGPINTLLDVVLSAYLHPAYAPPPVSFIHLEARDGGFFLHTLVQAVQLVVPPTALDIGAVGRIAPRPFTQAIAIDDIFAALIPGDLPIDHAVIVLEERSAQVAGISLLVYRAPSAPSAAMIDAVIPTTLTLEAPGLGESWQVIVQSIGTFPTTPHVTWQGHFWAVDTAGNESNHAAWAVQMPGPRARILTRGLSFSLSPPQIQTVSSDLFSLGIPGDDPLISCTVELTEVLDNFTGVRLVAHRSDSGVPDINLTPLLGVPQVLPTPPLGITWQLLIDYIDTPALAYTVIFFGFLWFTDSNNVESNHARLGVTLR